jgi:hypothetical protein
MYYVIGNSPKKVELKDLNDCIYYKQQKVYTDEQYIRSVDIKRAIERKLLIVLKKSEDKTGSFDINTAVIPSEVKVTDQSFSPKMDLLLDRIQDLEKSIKNNEVPGNTDVLSVILDRLEKLEKNPASIDVSSIQEMLKTIEAKIQSNKSDGILDKLESILNRAPGSAPVIKEEEIRRVEDMYVPNIRVEDAKSHINLQVRTIDTGDSVSDSLKKLKELRSKSN